MAFDPKEFLREPGSAAAPDKQPEKSAGFDIDQFLATTPDVPIPETTGPNMIETAVKGAAGTALTAYGYGGDYLGPRDVYRTVGQPLLEAAGSTFEKYINQPFQTGRGSRGPIGLPTVDIAREAAPAINQQVGKVVSTSPLTTSPVTGASYPASVPDYRAVQKMAGPEIGEKMSAAYARGGNTAVLEMLDKDAAARQLMNNPDFAKAVQAYREAVPTTGMQKLGRGLGLLGRTAARVAGPVGLGMTAYDIYTAAPYAARMLQTGVAGRQGQLGQTADEMPMVTGPVEPNYIDEIKRRAAEKALGR